MASSLLFGGVLVAAGLATWAGLGGRRNVLWLIAFLVAVSLVRVWYIVAVGNELSGDEAQYWDWSRRLDWCYATKGPGVAFCIWVARGLLGDTELAVRAPAVVFSFASSVVLFLLGRRLHGEKVGVWAAVLLQLTPIYAFYGIAMTTDPPLVFLWLLAVLLMHRAIVSGSPLAWLSLGLTVGLGILAKYTMAVFVLPGLLMLVLTPARRQLKRPWPYLAALVCLAAVSPVLIWNSQHGWVNFLHNAGHTKLSKGLGFSLVNFATFTGSQLGIVTPLLLVMMVWAAIKVRAKDQLSLIFSVPLLALFTLKSIQGEVLTNWALCCYLTGLISFSAYYLARWGELGGHARRLAGAAVVTAAVATVVMHVWLALPDDRPVLAGAERVATAAARLWPATQPAGEVRLKDPLSRIRRGAPALGRAVGDLEAELGGSRFVFSDNYQIASLLAFYVPDRPRTYCVNLDRRFNQFDIWPGFEDLRGHDAILVMSGDRPMPMALADQFESFEERTIGATSAVGNVANTYSVFLCRGFKGAERIRPQRYN